MLMVDDYETLNHSVRLGMDIFISRAVKSPLSSLHKLYFLNVSVYVCVKSTNGLCVLDIKCILWHDVVLTSISHSRVPSLTLLGAGCFFLICAAERPIMLKYASYYSYAYGAFPIDFTPVFGLKS